MLPAVIVIIAGISLVVLVVQNAIGGNVPSAIVFGILGIALLVIGIRQLLKARRSRH